MSNLIKNVYIIHGYGASAEHHWFPWLKKELEKKDTNVVILNLPAPNSPNSNEWSNALKEQIKIIDKNSYFIAHSLGCISLLKFLEALPNSTKIGGYILVSGFNAPLFILKELDAFLKPTIDYEKLKNISSNRVVISSKDDSIVPFNLSNNLSNSLDAKLLVEEKGGHFLETDGFEEFPLVLNEFNKFLNE
ncbi:protein of unknown function DUF1234 [Arcobacter nitrofigilis DSM 7299]|uniref:Serine hydrolase family protein n=1 Tax=Arcobacter nitrofigilis (strain ATCC 33309 / DSM 7299 / CCUG 15893 / LMG 7604 / NCTC 12251 / CI) TaxID=572480 RepID=D5UZM7_ARCNC|nr:alpha/beta hydrolase [Arcobacter nitrofigilis]ADG93246.1 protein of unknown function DUF1234 [Arcobacter nitrofigilis DSM 7299]